LPETAYGILNVFQIAAASPRVGNVVGGVYSRSGDIAKAIGFQWTEGGNETLFLASHLLLGARAAGIRYPLASSAQEFTKPDLVRAKYQRARNIGFRGALVIHPSAVPIANEIFSSPKQGEEQ
jgi:citrate lyase subunit beta/citryl-CoA lyase